MKGVLLAGILFCLITAMSVNQNSGESEYQVEEPMAARNPQEYQNMQVRENEKTVLVVFEGAMSKDLSGLTVRNSNNETLMPVNKTGTEEPAYGIYRLVPGKYSFSFQSMDDSPEQIEKAEFEIENDTDKALVLYNGTVTVFKAKSKRFSYINPLYADSISEDDLPEITVEQEAENLEDFYKSLQVHKDDLKAESLF